MARRISSKRPPRNSANISQIPFQHVDNPNPPLELLNEDQIAAIHNASMRVIQETGMRVDDPVVRTMLKKVGCKVDKETTIVQFDRHFIEEYIAKAPAEFTIHAKNADRSLKLGGNRQNFFSVSGPPFANDLDKGRRAGDFETFKNSLRIIQSINVCHGTGTGVVAPTDLSPVTRHLDLIYSCATMLDKVWATSLIGRTRAEDAIDMACILHQTDRAGLKKRPTLLGNINTNSPLVLDTAMSQGAMAMAENGQPVVVTPFTLSGAMSPASIPGALVQQNAEALAGIAFLQLVNPGNPSIYGTFTSNVDMRTGSPAFGTPEYVKATLASAQLARHYKVPVRASNTNASNVVDAQATYESQMSLWACILGHVNMINHSFGWLEGGLSASMEKMIVDAEMVQMLIETLKPLDFSEKNLGIDAIAEVGPGGHFFGAADTLSRYEDAFYTPMLSDWRNFENWAESGSLTATQRANGIWKEMVANYTAPDLDPSIVEELQEFVSKRKKEIALNPSSV